MREILVSNLVKELLGPRTGQIDETLDSYHMPITEFTTGILSPVDEDQSQFKLTRQLANQLLVQYMEAFKGTLLMIVK